MKNKDNLDLFSKTISEYLKERGAELKSDDEGIKKVLNNSSKLRTDILESAPKLEEINNKVKNLTEIILRTKGQVENAVSKYEQLYKDISELYEKTKNLEYSLKESQSLLKSTERAAKWTNGIVIGGFIVFVLAFVGWLIDDYNLRWTKTEQLNQEISRIEQKIIEYDSKIDSFTELSSKNGELNDNYISSKIEALINKAMLEFYKSQGVSKK